MTECFGDVELSECQCEGNVVVVTVVAVTVVVIYGDYWSRRSRD